MEERIQLPAEDHSLALQACARVLEAQGALGIEYERHLTEVAWLRTRIETARREYQALVSTLAQKHVKVAGKHDFRPDIGAFVRAQEQEQ